MQNRRRVWGEAVSTSFTCHLIPYYGSQRWLPLGPCTGASSNYSCAEIHSCPFERSIWGLLRVTASQRHFGECVNPQEQVTVIRIGNKSRIWGGGKLTSEVSVAASKISPIKLKQASLPQPHPTIAHKGGGECLSLAVLLWGFPTQDSRWHAAYMK